MKKEHYGAIDGLRTIACIEIEYQVGVSEWETK